MAEQDALTIYFEDGEIEIIKDPNTNSFIQEYISYLFQDTTTALFEIIGGWNISRRNAKDNGIPISDPARYTKISLISKNRLQQIDHIEYKDQTVMDKFKGNLRCVIPLNNLAVKLGCPKCANDESNEQYLYRVWDKYHKQNPRQSIEKFAEQISCKPEIPIREIIEEEQKRDEAANESLNGKKNEAKIDVISNDYLT